ncbi:hypothetical protein COV61_05065 [Candidatus Micrarchaeota archaeon CG11_big_fil_rev_8_21_14_0_20_47_5]|nr:MAG: hypothetical protein AUJ17_05685 [Candidatus Micrarchaeota archaeon CG1_02_47_40]PIN82748.1 MAG: hypothetical protein COV61_05065 [Candidatus Micrarchaeota archaeon CG11_big_fil_rev_8_21_14_0_20_47_5]
MRISTLIFFALSLAILFFLFQSISAFLSPPIVKASVPQSEDEAAIQTLTINSMEPVSAIQLAQANKKAEIAKPVPSERKKQMLSLEERLGLYTSLFEQAEGLNIDGYEGEGAN